MLPCECFSQVEKCTLSLVLLLEVVIHVYRLRGKATAIINYQTETYCEARTYMKMLERVFEIPFSDATLPMDREGKHFV